MGSRFLFVDWLRSVVVISRILGSGRSVSRRSITGSLGGDAMGIRVILTKEDIARILNERGVILDCRDIAIGMSIIHTEREIVVWIKCIEKEGG